MESTFLFCSILVLLSALIFESGKSKDGNITGFDYVVVVLVISVVALSSVYFGWVLMIEVYRSCAFYRSVVGKRKREKKEQDESNAGCDEYDRKTSPAGVVGDFHERGESTDLSWNTNPQVVSIAEDGGKDEADEESSKQPDFVHEDEEQLCALSSFNSSQDAGIPAFGKTGTRKPIVQRRAKRLEGNGARKKNIAVELSSVCPEETSEKGVTNRLR